MSIYFWRSGRRSRQVTPLINIPNIPLLQFCPFPITDVPGGDAQDDTINKIFNWNVIEVSYVVLYYNLLLFYFIEMANINKSNGRS